MNSIITVLNNYCLDSFGHELSIEDRTLLKKEPIQILHTENSDGCVVEVFIDANKNKVNWFLDGDITLSLQYKNPKHLEKILYHNTTKEE